MEQIDDKWIRVSTILSSVPSIGTDGKWDFPQGKIDPTVLKNKADLGTSVHAAIAAHCEGQFYSLTEREEGYFESYLLFENAVKPKNFLAEKRFFYEPMRLTGSIDLMIKGETDDSYQIIDFKCSSSTDHKKWMLQAAFYKFLAEKNGFSITSNPCFIQLAPNRGMPIIHQYEITKEVTTTALSLYNLYCYLTKK